jgi:hypothetical protein
MNDIRGAVSSVTGGGICVPGGCDVKRSGEWL